MNMIEQDLANALKNAPATIAAGAKANAVDDQNLRNEAAENQEMDRRAAEMIAALLGELQKVTDQPRLEITVSEFAGTGHIIPSGKLNPLEHRVEIKLYAAFLQGSRWEPVWTYEQSPSGLKHTRLAVRYSPPR